MAADNWRTGNFGNINQNAAVFFRLRKWMRTQDSRDLAEARGVLSSVAWTPSKTTEDMILRAMDFATRGEIRLDMDVNHGDGDSPGHLTPLVETIPDEEHEHDTERAALSAAWERVIETVPADDRERDILDSRLLTEVPDTLQEIGKRWGITRERVRQIEEKLIERLRDAAVRAELRAA